MEVDSAAGSSSTEDNKDSNAAASDDKDVDVTNAAPELRDANDNDCKKGEQGVTSEKKPQQVEKDQTGGKTVKTNKLIDMFFEMKKTPVKSQPAQSATNEEVSNNQNNENNQNSDNNNQKMDLDDNDAKETNDTNDTNDTKDDKQEIEKKEETKEKKEKKQKKEPKSSKKKHRSSSKKHRSSSKRSDKKKKKTRSKSKHKSSKKDKKDKKKDKKKADDAGVSQVTIDGMMKLAINTEKDQKDSKKEENAANTTNTASIAETTNEDKNGTDAAKMETSEKKKDLDKIDETEDIDVEMNGSKSHGSEKKKMKTDSKVKKMEPLPQDFVTRYETYKSKIFDLFEEFPEPFDTDLILNHDGTQTELKQFKDDLMKNVPNGGEFDLDRYVALVAKLVEQQSCSLSKLSSQVQAVLLTDVGNDGNADFDFKSVVTLQKCRELILKAAERKIYGIKGHTKCDHNEVCLEDNKVAVDSNDSNNSSSSSNNCNDGSNGKNSRKKWEKCRIYVWEARDSKIMAKELASDIKKVQRARASISTALKKYDTYVYKYETLSGKKNMKLSEKVQKLQKPIDDITAWEAKQDLQEKQRLEKKEKEREKARQKEKEKKEREEKRAKAKQEAKEKKEKKDKAKAEKAKENEANASGTPQKAKHGSTTKRRTGTKNKTSTSKQSTFFTKFFVKSTPNKPKLLKFKGTDSPPSGCDSGASGGVSGLNSKSGSVDKLWYHEFSKKPNTTYAPLHAWGDDASVYTGANEIDVNSLLYDTDAAPLLSMDEARRELRQFGSKHAQNRWKIKPNAIKRVQISSALTKNNNNNNNGPKSSKSSKMEIDDDDDEKSDSDIDMETGPMSNSNNSSRADLIELKYKLLQFEEDHRPPFFGVMDAKYSQHFIMSANGVINGRKCFKKVLVEIDYECDDSGVEYYSDPDAAEADIEGEEIGSNDELSDDDADAHDGNETGNKFIVAPDDVELGDSDILERRERHHKSSKDREKCLYPFKMSHGRGRGDSSDKPICVRVPRLMAKLPSMSSEQEMSEIAFDAFEGMVASEVEKNRYVGILRAKLAVDARYDFVRHDVSLNAIQSDVLAAKRRIEEQNEKLAEMAKLEQMNKKKKDAKDLKEKKEKREKKEVKQKGKGKDNKNGSEGSAKGSVAATGGNSGGGGCDITKYMKAAKCVTKVSRKRKNPWADSTHGMGNRDGNDGGKTGTGGADGKAKEGEKENERNDMNRDEMNGRFDGGMPLSKKRRLIGSDVSACSSNFYLNNNDNGARSGKVGCDNEVKDVEMKG